jgi:iron complex outermembrane recepter protein
MSRRSCLSLAGLGLLLAPGAVSAQSTPATDSDAVSEGIEDIVVTAQRREERLQDVPIAVTAISGTQLTNSGVATTQDLVTVTPALTISQNGGTFLPRLRGIGASFGGPGIENSIATYVDGVYIAAAPASLFSLAGVERVEILKGPQGTLFGRNATGGLIQVVTKKPSELFSGSISGSYGNYDTVGGDAYMTDGFAPGLAIDVAAHVSFQRDGFGRNRFLGTDANRTDRDLAFRSQVHFENGGTSIRLAVDYSKVEGSPFEFRRSPYDISTLGPILENQSPWDTNSNLPYYSATQSYGISLTGNQELGFADLVSISAARGARLFTQLDADTTPTNGFTVDFREKDKQFSQELQLVSKPGSAVNWLLGGYLFDARSRYSPVNLNFGPILQNPSVRLATLRTFNSQETRSYAMFGQVTVPLGEATRLTGGLRYTIERKRFSAEQFGIFQGSTTPIPFAQRDPDSVRYKKLTWRASLDHRFTPDVMGYASVNRGFKSGGFNPGGGVSDPPFQPEQLDAYEVGLKADLFGRKFRFNPSFFYYDYTNLQVTAFTPQAIPIFVNGPSAEIYGIDLDFEVQPIKRLTIRGGLSIIHDRFGDFPGAAFVFPNPPPIPGGVQQLRNAKGNRIPFTPDWASTIAVDYMIPLSFGEATLSATYNHSDGYYMEVDNLRRQAPYDILNASVRVESDSGWFANLWARNLLDEAVIIRASGSASFGGTAQYQAPRTYGVTLGTKF